MVQESTSHEAQIRVDHAGRAESLNVAMVATIISYELSRARE